ncbi:MAG TPA: helix-hairpin-helix domain-containing protein [Candidatus Lokiarchaeia archaeon]|nr:helix-hairpin-helix domain-containing protein [Candidatus Lokiarchaeia archaeon]
MKITRATHVNKTSIKVNLFGYLALLGIPCACILYRDVISIAAIYYGYFSIEWSLTLFPILAGVPVVGALLVPKRSPNFLAARISQMKWSMQVACLAAMIASGIVFNFILLNNYIFLSNFDRLSVWSVISLYDYILIPLLAIAIFLLICVDAMTKTTFKSPMQGMGFASFRLLRAIGISSARRLAAEDPQELAAILQVRVSIAQEWVQQARATMHLPPLDENPLSRTENSNPIEEKLLRLGVKNTEAASFLIIMPGISARILKKIDGFGISTVDDLANENTQRLASALELSPALVAEWIRRAQQAIERSEEIQ